MTTISTIRGDTAIFDVALIDSAGDPVDLTGLAGTDIMFTAKRYFGDATPVIEKSIGDGIEIDADPTTGLFVLTLDPADTEALSPRIRRLRWDVQVTDDDIVQTPLIGVLRVNPDVTEPPGS